MLIKLGAIFFLNSPFINGNIKSLDSLQEILPKSLSTLKGLKMSHFARKITALLNRNRF